MTSDLTKEAIAQAVSRVEHPEIATTLLDLGMIQDVEYSADTNVASLTLVLPFMGIPIAVRDYMVNSLRQAVGALGAELNVSFAEMTPEERSNFTLKSAAMWKG